MTIPARTQWRHTAAALLAACSFAALAQPTAFPEGVAALTAELFDAQVAGGSFAGRRADGVDMRLDIDKDGTLTWYSRGKSERGKWSLEEGKFCQRGWPRSPDSCNDLRIGEDAIYYKRIANDEVVTLKRR